MFYFYCRPPLSLLRRASSLFSCCSIASFSPATLIKSGGMPAIRAASLKLSLWSWKRGLTMAWEL